MPTETQRTTASASSSTQEALLSWVVYVFLLVWRVLICTALPGYIHPDEFFQGGQELWFGCSDNTIPWEFESHHALRSIVPPTVMTWLPLRLYGWFFRKASSETGDWKDCLSGLEVYIIPRICCALLSALMVDVSVWILTAEKKNKYAVVPTAVLVLASAWPTWVILNRPFTNALETMILAQLLLAVHRRASTSSICSIRGSVFVGVLCALGLFTRFTFVCYAFPMVSQFLVETFISLSQHDDSSERTRPGIGERIGQWLRYVVLPMGMGFCLATAGLVFADLCFYQSTSSVDDENNTKWTSYLTPLNALLYNSQVGNLRHHGLHPRWTHVLVNMPMLYGPLAVAFYVSVAKVFFCRNNKSSPVSSKDCPIELTDKNESLRNTCRWTIVSGLGLLSCAPHQEPRFLLPLLVPLVILSDKAMKSRMVRLIWIVFNLILFVVFGVLHQGGVIPSVWTSSWLDSVDDGNAPLAAIYFHTYMPPTFLSRKPVHSDATCLAATGEQKLDDVVCTDETNGRSQVCQEYPIVDLKGADFQALQVSLDWYLSCITGANAEGSEDTSASSKYVHLVAPPMGMYGDDGEDLVLSQNCFVGSSFDCLRIRTHHLHLSTEDFPPFKGSIYELVGDLILGVYQISCG